MKLLELMKIHGDQISAGIYLSFPALACSIVMLMSSPSLAESARPTALSETFGTWQINCQSTPDSKDNVQQVCQMSQQQTDSKSGRMVMLFAIDKADAKTKTAAATAILPFGVDLNTPLSLQVDEIEIAKGNYVTCLPQGCLARFSVNPAMLSTLIKGKAAQLSMKAYSAEEPTNFTLSLEGFASAASRLAALDK